MSSPKALPYRDEFEKHGETGTRFHFADREGEIGKAARTWLAEIQSKREEEVAAKRDAREEETLSIARQALSDARVANKIAISAIILATLATIVTAVIGVIFSK